MIAWHGASLRVLPGHRLDVEFADGLHGVVDMSKDSFSGVFAPWPIRLILLSRQFAMVWWSGRTA